MVYGYKTDNGVISYLGASDGQERLIRALEMANISTDGIQFTDTEPVQAGGKYFLSADDEEYLALKAEEDAEAERIANLPTEQDRMAAIEEAISEIAELLGGAE